jgi:hypothetical protein
VRFVVSFFVASVATVIVSPPVDLGSLQAMGGGEQDDDVVPELKGQHQ